MRSPRESVVKKGKPVLLDSLGFWNNMLEQEDIAVCGLEGQREGQSGRIRPQLGSQMGTGKDQM